MSNTSENVSFQSHKLKVYPEFFKAMRNDSKRFEIRKKDRDFHINDSLLLQEWDPEKEVYTGSSIIFTIKYVLAGEKWGLKPDFVILGL
jgi:hypothetical protein